MPTGPLQHLNGRSRSGSPDAAERLTNAAPLRDTMACMTPGPLGTLSLLFVLWAVVLWKRGPQVALGVACIAAMLMPRWYELQLAGLPFDMRTLIAIIGLTGILLHPRGQIRSPLVLLDAIVAALVITHVASDTLNVEFTPWLPLRAYGEWALPYVTGRLAVRNGLDIAGIIPWAAGLLVTLSGLAIFEAVSRINLFDVVFGPPLEVAGQEKFPRNVLRLGFLRSLGPTEHAIFHGLVQLSLLPWAWAATRSDRFRKLGWFALVVGVVGIFATLSRGPMLGAGLAGGFLLAVWSKWFRWPLIVVIVATVAAVVAMPERVLTMVGKTINEDRFETDIEIDGVRYEMSGTLARYLLLKAYWPAVQNAGPLGFGTAATGQFPPRVDPMPEAGQTRRMLRAPDNSYLMLTLRFGWIGTVLLPLLLGVAIWTGTRLRDDRSLLGLPLALAASLFGIAAAIATVYPSYDYVFEMFFAIGIVGGLRSFTR